MLVLREGTKEHDVPDATPPARAVPDFTEHRHAGATRVMSAAEEADPPAVASWSKEQVAEWMKGSGIRNADEIAAKMIKKEVDGDALIQMIMQMI